MPPFRAQHGPGQANLPDLPDKDRQAAPRHRKIRPEIEGLLPARAQVDDQEDAGEDVGPVIPGRLRSTRTLGCEIWGAEHTVAFRHASGTDAEWLLGHMDTDIMPASKQSTDFLNILLTSRHLGVHHDWRSEGS
jgi:hypothetical protein